MGCSGCEKRRELMRLAAEKWEKKLQAAADEIKKKLKEPNKDG